VNDLIQILDWDSAFFGFRVAQISRDCISEGEMVDALAFCKDRHIRLLQFKCDAHDRDSVRLAEANGFHFADMRMILEQPLPQTSELSPFPAGVIFRLATDKDLPALINIAKNLYFHSRYYFDINFPRLKLPEFYSDWVRKAVTGQFDDLAWVLAEGGTPIAFCSARVGRVQATIGLVGLHPAFTGRGLGKAVVTRSLVRMAEIGCRSVSVTTQGRNYPAQRLYQRTGFMISKAQIYYHRWFSCEAA
jgi:ribosomal protein S18 acetylase RimI-like enzyme